MAESSFAHQLPQVAIGRRDQARSRCPLPHVAESRHRSALEDEEQLPLQIEIEVPDLVEEQRASVRLLEHTGLVLDGTGVRPAPGAEEVCRQQRRRDRAQVGDDQRPLDARARMQDLLGQVALPGSGLSFEQDGQRRSRQDAHLAAQDGHRGSAAPENGPLL